MVNVSYEICMPETYLVTRGACEALQPERVYPDLIITNVPGSELLPSASLLNPSSVVTMQSEIAIGEGGPYTRATRSLVSSSNIFHHGDHTRVAAGTKAKHESTTSTYTLLSD